MRASPSRLYLNVIAIGALASVGFAAAGIAFSSLRSDLELWLFFHFPIWLSAGLIVTLPVSAIWLGLSLWLKRRPPVKHLLLSFLAAVLGLLGALLSIYSLARGFFPA